MSTPYGLAAARTANPDDIRYVLCATSSLQRGAVVIWDSSAIKNKVKAPTGAGDTGVAGVIVDELPSTGTSAGSYYNIQIRGKCPVLLDAGQAVTVGGKVIISDTDGSVKAIGTTDSCDIVGRALQTLTAGSNNDLIEVELGIAFSGDTVP